MQRIDADSERCASVRAAGACWSLRRRRAADPRVAGACRPVSHGIPGAEPGRPRRMARSRYPHAGRIRRRVRPPCQRVTVSGRSRGQRYRSLRRSPPRLVEVVGQDVEMATNALDVDGVVADGTAIAGRGARLPDGTRVGHTRALAPSRKPKASTRRCWASTSRAAAPARRSMPPAAITTTWLPTSGKAKVRRGARARPPDWRPSALIARDAAAFDATAERILAAGGRRRGNDIVAEDAWGNLAILMHAQLRAISK